MKHEILYGPAFATARILLDPGDSVRAESGAMISMSQTVTLTAAATGGIMKVVGRLLGGESAFQSTFTATHGSGEVLLAPRSMGDIAALPVREQGYMVSSGAYLAGDIDLDISTRTNVKAFFAGEGLFLMRISGNGMLLISTFGAIHPVELAAGQVYLVDSGHVVAFTETMEFKVRKAARTWLGSITSGEGVVAEFTGPGIVYIQTRSPHAFGSYISNFIPSES